MELGHGLVELQLDNNFIQQMLFRLLLKKERIRIREIHLRTTGLHLSMGSHSVICHPTEVTAPPSTNAFYLY